MKNKTIEIDKNTEGLIFDLDGTLADTMPAHLKAWQMVGDELNFEYPEQMFYDYAGMPTYKIVPMLNKKFNLSLDAESVIKKKEGYFLEIIKNIELIKPVADVAKKYFGKIPMSIGTGGKREIAIETIKITGLNKIFDIVVSADDVTNHKPHPETFLKCSELMKIQPGKCLVFEDGDLGLEAAKAAGMMSVDIRQFV